MIRNTGNGIWNGFKKKIEYMDNFLKGAEPKRRGPGRGSKIKYNR
jgi:hypothetical protein